MEIEVVLYSNILSAILALTALFASARPGGKPSRVFGIVTILVWVLILMICLEIFNFWSNGHNITWVRILKYITAPLHNYFTVLYPGLCCIFAYEYSFIREKSKKAWFLIISPSFVWAIVLITNYWNGVVFTIDENVVYHRGNLVYLTFVLPFVYYVAGVIITYANFHGNKNFLYFPIWTLAFPSLGGVLFQALNPGVSTIHLGVAIGICGVCISIQKERMYLDALTGIYNRSYLFYIFSLIEKGKWKQRIGAVMLDVNDFKYINDTYGHREGDKALTDVALILERSLVRGGVAIRFAGDEFIIFVRQNKIEEALAEVLERIKRNTDIINNQGTNQYKISLAIGSSVMEEGEQPDDFLSRIDKKMYIDKAKAKMKGDSVRRRV